MLCGVFISASVSTSYAYSMWGGPTPPVRQQPHHYAREYIPPPVEHHNYNEITFWRQLRDSFKINHYAYTQQVRQQIEWFKQHQDYLDNLLTKAAPYMYYVYTQVKKRGLPGELVLMPVIESAYDPFAYSDRGAAGLWQLMPGTASGYGLKQDWWYDGRRDIYASTNAALNYLTYLQNFFSGNWLYAIASYDAGTGTLQNAIQYNAEHDRSTSFWYLPLPSETDTYVPRILALAAIIDTPNRYGIDLPKMKDGPYFARVNLGSQINLSTAAHLAGISLRELYKLNPGYNRWATDPNGPYSLLLPINKIDEFKENFAKLPEDKLITWNRYQVKPGDSLSLIAREFRTRIALLQEINKLNSYILQPGQILLIPQNTKSLQRYNFTPEISYANHKQIAIDVKKVIVTVYPGDTLGVIAQRYHVNDKQIIEWNKLDPHADLQIGQKLALWIQQRSEIPSTIQQSKHYNLYRTFTVKTGDNLDYIAKKYGTTITSLKKLNNLHSNNLQVGQSLKIPPSDVAVFVTKTPNHESMIDYRIKSGDNLDYLAREYRTTVDAIKHVNDLRSNNLQVGELIKIPSKQFTDNSVAATSVKPTRYYRVKSGDDLDYIARKYKITVNSIKQVNDLRNNMLRVGELIKIPDNKTAIIANHSRTLATVRPERERIVYYKVKPGDTLDEIARKYHVSVIQLKKWNQPYLRQFIQVGQSLVIYTG